MLLILFAAVAARWPGGAPILERALQDLTSKDNLQRLRELSEQDGTAEAYRNERRKYWHLEEVARDKARNARRDMTKWEADWLLGATASQVGIEAVVALGVKDADVRERSLRGTSRRSNRHSIEDVADDGAARHRQGRTEIDDGTSLELQP